MMPVTCAYSTAPQSRDPKKKPPRNRDTWVLYHVVPAHRLQRLDSSFVIVPAPLFYGLPTWECGAHRPSGVRPPAGGGLGIGLLLGVWLVFTSGLVCAQQAGAAADSASGAGVTTGPAVGADGSFAAGPPAAAPPAGSGSAAQAEPPAVATSTSTAPAERGEFPRLLATLGVGLPLRLTRDRDLGQGRLGPRYLDARVGYLLARGGSWQHGPALQLSTGLSEDGGFHNPVDAFEQWVVAPGYGVAHEAFQGASWLLHGFLPFALTGGRSLGVELTAALAYRVLAGLGLYAELGGGAFFGYEGAPHPMLTAELGLVIDYEVLP